MSAEAALKIVDEVESKALSIVDQAKAVVVTDAETYTRAGALWTGIKDMIAEVKETFDPICDAAHKAHKAATAKRAQYLDPLEKASKDVKSLMSAYDAEQERIRQAEQARLAEIARKEEEDRRLEEALLAEEFGDAEEAAAILEEPVHVAPVVVPKSTPKVQGLSYREIWAAEVVNIRELCRAVADGRASTECISANMPTLNRMATALKSTMNVPGVRAYSRRV